MNKFYLKTLLLCLFSFFGMTKTFAHDIAVTNADGVIIYYKYINNKTELEVTYRGNSYYSYTNEYLGSVIIPGIVTYGSKTYSVTSIGYNAFRGCSDLTSVSIPGCVTFIGSDAFKNCSKLKDVTIYSNYIVSKDYSSSSCLRDIFGSQVTNYKLSDDLTRIGNYAFYGCTSLTSVVIPRNVTSIGKSAFSRCNNLKKVIVKDLAKWFGITFSDEYANPLSYSHHLYSDEDTEITDLVIPNSVTSIRSYAFYGCSGLTSVTIPNNVTSIGSYAFSGCSGLTSMTIPNSVTSIGGYAFSSCFNLKDVTINSNLIVSKDYNSSSCLRDIFGNQVTNYKLRDDLTQIGNYAFCGCTGLASVVIPDNVTSIGWNAFDGVPTKALKVKRGTTSLLALWNRGYEPYEAETASALVQPTPKAVPATQSSLTVKVEPTYSEYRYYIYRNSRYYDMTNGEELLLTGLFPEYDYLVDLYIVVGSMESTPKPYNINKSYFIKTQPISPSADVRQTASSLHLTGSYIEGDAEVTSQSIAIYNYNSQGTTNSSNLVEAASGNRLSMTGLNPNTSYIVKYTIVANGRTYTDTQTVKTEGLTLTTSQPKVVSLGNVIVAAESNLDDEETNVGFEWRRTDWSDDFASNTGGAYLYDGTMEGYIRNLNTEKLWKYRPYYLSNSGTYYYGDWVGLDPTNTSYFEPTVHTYASINIEGNTALVKGYALTGTDKVTVQGFKYWKSVAGAKGRDAASMIAAIPNDAMTVEASGQVMTANLTGLDYNSTYHYVAFVTTSEGDTYYGEEQVFSTGEDPTGIGDIYSEPSEREPATVVARYNMNGLLIVAPQKGVNILRMSDGSVKKVYVR